MVTASQSDARTHRTPKHFVRNARETVLFRESFGSAHASSRRFPRLAIRASFVIRLPRRPAREDFRSSRAEAGHSPAAPYPGEGWCFVIPDTRHNPVGQSINSHGILNRLDKCAASAFTPKTSVV